MLKMLRSQKRKEISRRELKTLMGKKDAGVPDHTMSAVVRELVRHGVLIRMGSNADASYRIEISEISKLAGALTTMQMPKRAYDTRRIFGKFKTLGRKEVEDLLPDYTVTQIDHIIIDLRKMGFMSKLDGHKARARYIVHPGPDQEPRFQDPIRAAVSVFGRSILFCCNTALELHGLSRYDMSFVLYVHGRVASLSGSLEGVTVKPVKLRAPRTGIMSMKRMNIAFNLTDIERTIIDCVHHPAFALGWENVVYALRRVERLRSSRVLEYLKAIRIPSLCAKMGIVLEYFKKKWNIPNSLLNELRRFCAPSPVSFLRFNPGKLNTNWNIYVPEGLFNGM